MLPSNLRAPSPSRNSESPTSPTTEPAPPRAPSLPRRIPRDRTRPVIRYTLEGLPAPTAFEKHRLAAEALFAQDGGR